MPPRSEVHEVELADGAADSIADAVADRIDAKSRFTPRRTELGDVGVQSKPGEKSVIYGGNDMYVDVGSTDAEIATNLYLVKTVLSAADPKTGRANRTDWRGNPLVSERLEQVMVSAAQKALQGAPADVPEFAPNGYGGMKAVDPDGFAMKSYKAMRLDAAKAMTSTGAGVGDEWVPTFASAELWRDVHLRTEVAANVRRVNMPTNPYDLPTLTADATFYLAATENTAVTGSQPTTAKATLSAKKVQADVTFSGEVTEDSVVPMIPAVRENLVRRGAQAIDDLIVSGDTETGGTGNVNSDDTAPAATSFYLAFNGMRKFCIVTNTAQVVNQAAATTTATFTTLRALLGKYGARPSDVVAVVPTATMNTMYDIASVRTIDTYGPNATIIRGELARFFGIPLLGYEAIPGLSSDKTAADGKADASTPSNNTLGWLLLFNRTQWTAGFRREFQVESDRNIQTDSNILVASFRMALIPSGIATTHTAIARNVTV